MASNFLIKLLLWPIKQFYVRAYIFTIIIYVGLKIIIGCYDLQEYEEINKVYKYNEKIYCTLIAITFLFIDYTYHWGIGLRKASRGTLLPLVILALDIFLLLFM